MILDQPAQTEPLVQLANQNQPAIRGNSRPLKIDFEKPIEGELKRFVFFFTHWVFTFLAVLTGLEPL